MPQFIMFVGLPASGKSTWRADMKLDGYEQISTDDLIDAHAAAVGLTYDEVFKDYMPIAEGRFWGAIADAVKNKRNIVLDRTNLSVKTRRRILSKLTNDYSKFAVVFMPPRDSVDRAEHKRRLADRPGKTIPMNILTMMEKQFELPTKNEGFDSVQIFDLWGRPMTGMREQKK